MNKPAAPAPRPVPARTKTALQPNPAAGNARPLARPTAPNPSPSALPEPSRAEHLDAMADLEAVLAYLEDGQREEGPDAQAAALEEALAKVQEVGRADGPLAVWWQDWKARWAPVVAQILEHLDAQEEQDEPDAPVEAPMDMDGLKALLLQRLDEGHDDGAILAELVELVPAETLAEWRKFLKPMPLGMAAAYLGGGQHADRLKALLKMFENDGE